MRSRKTKKRSSLTLVVTARNPPWASHAEWMPRFRKLWLATSGPTHRVRVIHIDSIRDAILHRASLEKADRIVLCYFGRFLQLSRGASAASASTLPFDNLVEYIRVHLRLATPVLIHAHGDFSSGAVAYLGVEKRLAPARFICTSTSDARALRLCYGNMPVALCPYPLAPEPRPAARRIRHPRRRLIYAGRISEQKNLHQLFLALWIFERKNPDTKLELWIYGSPDRLGSPNMAMKGERYEKQLRELSKGLRTRIRWKGWVSPGRVRRELQRPGSLTISPSLHSDESFGSVVFHALASGAPVVLTAWGGHLDLAKDFRSQCHPIEVHASPAGPYVSPVEIAEALHRALGAEPGSVSKCLKNYRIDEASRKLRPLIGFGSLKPYRRTALGRKVASQYLGLDHRLRERIQHVFRAYDDPLAQPFFRAWGMKSGKGARGKVLLIPDWVRISRNLIRVRDPHRGRFSFQFRSGPSSAEAVFLPSGRRRAIPRTAADWLVRFGFGYGWDG